MSGGGGGEWGYRVGFTAVQWQELQQQAMIYKYLVAGLPVPPDLLESFRRSFDAISAARFFQNPAGSAVGYYSYYGKKFDPEPGRCRRTDGKKWRCSKEAHPDSKYCERHMHRGRNRSRKHVESQSTSQPLPTAIAQVSTGGSTISNDGNFNGSSGGSFKRAPLYSVDTLEGSMLGRNATRVRMESAYDGTDNKEFRYRGLTPVAESHAFAPQSSCSAGNPGYGHVAVSSMWRPIHSQLSSSLSFEQNPGNSFAQPHIPHAFQLIDSSTLSKQHQQQPEHVFLGEWSTTKDSWSNLDESGSDQSIFSSTQLSMAIPRGSPDCSLTSSYATNDP